MLTALLRCLCAATALPARCGSAVTALMEAAPACVNRENTVKKEKMQPSLAGGLLVVLLAAVQVGPARARAYDCGVCMSSSSICVNWTGYSACSNGVGDALDAHPMSIRVPRSEVLEASQSSPFPVDENLNSISLKSNVPFLNVASCKTTFTVTGLRGSITSSSKALAVNNDTSQACARNGVWEMDEDAGTLVDQVAANTCFENSSWVNFAGKGYAAYLANKTMCDTQAQRWTMPLLFVLVLAVAAIGAATTFSQASSPSGLSQSHARASPPPVPSLSPSFFFLPCTPFMPRV